METLVEKKSVVIKAVYSLPALQNACSKDLQFRPAMSKVMIHRKKDGNFYAVATNSHILAEINFSYFFGNNSDLNCFPDKFYLTPADWKKLTGKIGLIDWNFETGTAKVFSDKFVLNSIIEIISEETFSEKGDKFPDYDQIWPLDEMKMQIDEIGLNYALFEELGSCLVPAGKNPNRALKLSFFAKNRPVMVKPVDPDFSEICKGLIMPVIIID